MLSKSRWKYKKPIHYNGVLLFLFICVVVGFSMAQDLPSRREAQSQVRITYTPLEKKEAGNKYIGLIYLVTLVTSGVSIGVFRLLAKKKMVELKSPVGPFLLTGLGGYIASLVIAWIFYIFSSEAVKEGLSDPRIFQQISPILHIDGFVLSMLSSLLVAFFIVYGLGVLILSRIREMLD